jgi:hypothetical protein
MKLISEDIPSTNDVSVITEGKGDDKKLYISGPFLQAEKVNRNNRVYPMSVMEAAVDKYNTDYIQQNRALGELNHPAEPVVNPERAAIMTTELKRNGVYFEGKARVLSTPMGKIVENLLSDGVKIGVSSRGLGSLKPVREGFNEVQSDFVLTTAADVVFDPSAQSAFVEGVYESVDWIYESGIFRPVDLEEQRERLRLAKKREIAEVQLQIFEDLMKSLVNR